MQIFLILMYIRGIETMAKSNLALSDFIEKFIKGDSTDAYKFLGCHKSVKGYIFRVWAPNAKSVRLTGDFNSWSKEKNHMTYIKNGIWELCV